jgi:hypothetical protein
LRPHITSPPPSAPRDGTPAPLRPRRRC